MDRTQSRRQSAPVCSLLVVSLLLSAVVGGEGESIGVLSVDSQWDLYPVHAEHSLHGLVVSVFSEVFTSRVQLVYIAM